LTTTIAIRSYYRYTSAPYTKVEPDSTEQSITFSMCIGDISGAILILFIHKKSC
jgi:hypothetical protein